MRKLFSWFLGCAALYLMFVALPQVRAATIPCPHQTPGVSCDDKYVFNQGCVPPAKAQEWANQCETQGRIVSCNTLYNASQPICVLASCSVGYKYNNASGLCDLCAPGYTGYKGQCVEIATVVLDKSVNLFEGLTDSTWFGILKETAEREFKYGSGGDPSAQVRVEADWADESWLAQNINWDNVPEPLKSIFTSLTKIKFCSANADCGAAETCYNGLCSQTAGTGTGGESFWKKEATGTGIYYDGGGVARVVKVPPVPNRDQFSWLGAEGVTVSSTDRNAMGGGYSNAGLNASMASPTYPGANKYEAQLRIETALNSGQKSGFRVTSTAGNTTVPAKTELCFVRSGGDDCITSWPSGGSGGGGGGGSSGITSVDKDASNSIIATTLNGTSVKLGVDTSWLDAKLSNYQKILNTACTGNDFVKGITPTGVDCRPSGGGTITKIGSGGSNKIAVWTGKDGITENLLQPSSLLSDTGSGLTVGSDPSSDLPTLQIAEKINLNYPSPLNPAGVTPGTGVTIKNASMLIGSGVSSGLAFDSNQIESVGDLYINYNSNKGVNIAAGGGPVNIGGTLNVNQICLTTDPAIKCRTAWPTGGAGTVDMSKLLTTQPDSGLDISYNLAGTGISQLSVDNAILQKRVANTCLTSGIRAINADGTVQCAPDLVLPSGNQGYLPRFTGNTSDPLVSSIAYDNGSSVGIGTTASDARLHVYGFGAGDKALIVDSSSWNALEVDSLGKVSVGTRLGIGTKDPQARLNIFTANTTDKTLIVNSPAWNALEIDSAGKVTIGTQLCLGTDCRTSWPTGNVQGSGTSGTIALWQNGAQIGNSIIRQSGTTVDVSGTLLANGISVANAITTQNLNVKNISDASGQISVNADHLTISNIANTAYLDVRGPAYIGKTLLVSGDIDATDNTRADCAWDGVDIKESDGTQFICPDNKYLAGRKHAGDENGLTSYYCCRL